MERYEKRPASPYLVSHVTASPLLTLLSLVLTLRGMISLVRIAQRLQWLIFDFQPLGHWAEVVFMVVVQGAIFIGNLLSLLMMIAVLRLRFAHSPRRGRMLYRLCNLLKVLYTLGLLLSLSVTGLAVYGAVHYRLPSLWIAIPSVIGALLILITWTSRMYHKNLARVMVDINHSLKTGQFQRGRSVSCFLKTQSWLLSLCSLIPMAILLLWGVISVWLLQNLRELLGTLLVDQLLAELSGSLTSPFAMYGLELLEMGLTVLAYALTALLYARYQGAHDERLPYGEGRIAA